MPPADGRQRATHATIHALPNCPGGLILHADGSIAGCTNDETEDCRGLEERHEDAPTTCIAEWGRCDRCGIVV